MKSKIYTDVLSFFLFVYPFLPIVKEWSSFLGNFLEIILLILLLICSFCQSEFRRPVFKININIALLFLLLIVATFLGYKDFINALSGLRVFLIYIFLFQSITYQKYIDYDKLIKVMLLTSTIMGVGALIQFIAPELIVIFHTAKAIGMYRSKSDFQAFSIYNRAISFMTDPNILGVYLALMFQVLQVYYHGKKKEIKYYIVCIIQLLGILATQSRTGIVILLIYASILVGKTLVIKKEISTKKFVCLLTMLISFVCFISVKWDFVKKYLRFDTILSGNGRYIQNVRRWNMLKESEIIKIFFGHGLTNGRTIIFENSYLLTYYLFGIVGFTVFFFVIFNYIKHSINADINNLILVVSYFAVCFVGDYILIPQITYILICCLKINNSIKCDA